MGSNVVYIGATWNFGLTPTYASPESLFLKHQSSPGDPYWAKLAIRSSGLSWAFIQLISPWSPISDRKLSAFKLGWSVFSDFVFHRSSFLISNLLRYTQDLPVSEKISLSIKFFSVLGESSEFPAPLWCAFLLEALIVIEKRTETEKFLCNFNVQLSQILWPCCTFWAGIVLSKFD